MPKTLFFFLYPKAISAAEVEEQGTLNYLNSNSQKEVPCSSGKDVDKFCQEICALYGLEALSNLEAHFFVIDAGAKQTVRERLLLLLKACPLVSSLPIEHALPFAVMGKMELGPDNQLQLFYNGKQYELTVQGDSVHVECRAGSTKTDLISILGANFLVEENQKAKTDEKAMLIIYDEDFTVLAQPRIIQRSQEEKLQRLNEENETLYKALLEERIQREKEQEANERWAKGKTIEFGAFSWIILEKREDRALLISRDLVETRKFADKTNGWAASKIRAYLNGPFLKKKFSVQERKKIIETSNVFRTEVAQDYIFLLSLEEAFHFFGSDEERISSLDGTPYWYWLRSSGRSAGHSSSCVAYIDKSGAIIADGFFVSDPYGGVRPALWISLD